MSRTAFFFVICLGWLSQLAHAQVFDEKFEHWPAKLKINGQIVLGSSWNNADCLKDLPQNLLKDKHIVFVHDLPADASLLEACDKFLEEQSESKTFETVAEDFECQLQKLLEKCDVFCWIASQSFPETLRQQQAKIHDLLAKHLEGGGTIIALGHSAAMMGQFAIAVHNDQARIERGLNLVYDTAILSDYEDSPALRGHLLSMLAVHPRSVGIGLRKEGLLVLDGRKMFMRGTGEATFLLMANERQPIRVQTIVELHPQSPRPELDLIDLTEWRRDAIDRTLEPFPPENPSIPHVENGTLVIVGGGGMPSGLMERFIELAGGKEHARMVYIPCEERDDVGKKQSTVEAWKKMGVKHTTFIHTKDRDKANGDEEFLEPLRHATGIWFGGGRQWNFADSYYGTTAHKLMKEVLRRGGVIGGSSAGASIQARYLARATPIGNFRIRAPGYERGGLGFLSGVAIDQHFSQRKRQQDMTELMTHYPQLLGIGIDEATALIVQKSIADIVGRGKVHFYDRHLPVFPGRPDYIALPDGSCYDLAAREILKDTSIWFAPPLKAEKPAVAYDQH
ncbi:MAG TPA: Type 1 glutamine amidotransferase-like domain-containing protein [Planctomycetaceae bacterium]|nr:Type 1 glutamine amidotransferase-like domain-containing protein [Planctomycetaceae bacterium]